MWAREAEAKRRVQRASSRIRVKPGLELPLGGTARVYCGIQGHFPIALWWLSNVNGLLCLSVLRTTSIQRMRRASVISLVPRPQAFPRPQ